MKIEIEKSPRRERYAYGRRSIVSPLSPHAGIQSVIECDYDPQGWIFWKKKETVSCRLSRHAAGRWLSRDPIEEQGGVNLYAFTSNAPIVQIDILGEIVPAPGCHLNSPTCGGNGKVGIENPFPESWQTALIDFLRWWNGTHPQESNYGPDAQETKDLMESEIARRLREAFREKNQGRKCSDWKGLSGAGLKFGPIRFIKDIPNGRAHFVGSADGDVSIKIDSENCKVVATFVLENTTSLESFLYHLWFVENIEEPGLPRSNWVQRYTWQEEYECKKCDEEDL